jgi:hypothetical protein
MRKLNEVEGFTQLRETLLDKVTDGCNSFE